MKASQILPEEYREHGSISLKKNKQLFLWLTLLSIPWLPFCIFFFMALANRLRPFPSFEFKITTITGIGFAMIGVIAGSAITMVVVMFLHEMIHGLFYWLFTGSRPKFGFKVLYAYAAAPGWYVPRPQFFVVGAAPLVLLSLLGLALLMFIPWVAVPWVLIGLILNATGAIGDLYMLARLIVVPGKVLIEDQADGITWYISDRHVAPQLRNRLHS